MKDQSNYQESFSNLLSNIDLFAKTPSLRIFKKDRFTTKLGLFCTLCIGLFVLLSFIYLLSGLISSANPSVVQTEYSSINSQPITLLPENFTLAMSLVDLNLVALKTRGSVFTIEVQNCIRTRSLNSITGQLSAVLTCVNYSVQSCDLDKHFPTLHQQEYFQTFNLTNIFCINYDEWMLKPLSIQGTPSSPTYQYLQIVINKCQNLTNSPQCSSEDLINDSLITGYYAVHISDNLLQMNQLDSPFNQVINLQYSMFSNSISKDVFDVRREIITQTDRGIILTELFNASTLIQSQFYDSQTSYNNIYMIQHSITCDVRYSVYSRSYQKLQQMLGTIGGLYQVMYLTLLIIINPIVFFLMKLSIINRIFKFQPYCSKYKQQTQNSIFRTQLKKFPMNDKQKIESFLRYSQQSLILSLKEIILIYCGCRRKEKVLIDYATKKIQSKLDLEFLLTKLLEIDKLKQIILSQNQLKLFNYMSRPIIVQELTEKQQVSDLDRDPKYSFMINEEKSELMRLTEAFDAYERIKESAELIDIQLVKHLDHEIVDLFHQISAENFINEIPIVNSIELNSANQEIQRRNQQELINHIENSDLSYKINLIIAKPKEDDLRVNDDIYSNLIYLFNYHNYIILLEIEFIQIGMNSLTKPSIFNWKDWRIRNQALIVLTLESVVILLIMILLEYILLQTLQPMYMEASKLMMVSQMEKTLLMRGWLYTRNTQYLFDRSAARTMKSSYLFTHSQQLNYTFIYQPLDALSSTNIDWIAFNSSYCYSYFGQHEGSNNYIEDIFVNFTALSTQVYLMQDSFDNFYTTTQSDMLFSMFPGRQYLAYNPHVRPWYRNQIQSKQILVVSPPYLTWSTNSYVLTQTTNLYLLNETVIGVTGSEAFIQDLAVTKFDNSIQTQIIDNNGIIFLSSRNNEVPGSIMNTSLTGYDDGDFLQMLSSMRYQPFQNNCTQDLYNNLCLFNAKDQTEKVILMQKLASTGLILVLQMEPLKDWHIINTQLEIANDNLFKLFENTMLIYLGIRAISVSICALSFYFLLNPLDSIIEQTKYKYISHSKCKRKHNMRKLKYMNKDSSLFDLQNACNKFNSKIETSILKKHKRCLELERVQEFQLTSKMPPLFESLRIIPESQQELDTIEQLQSDRERFNYLRQGSLRSSHSL